VKFVSLFGFCHKVGFVGFQMCLKARSQGGAAVLEMAHNGKTLALGVHAKYIFPLQSKRSLRVSIKRVS
jgi:hypothetical protein